MSEGREGRREGRREGKEEGGKEGRMEGRKRGRREGGKEGRKEGDGIWKSLGAVCLVVAGVWMTSDKGSPEVTWESLRVGRGLQQTLEVSVGSPRPTERWV